VLELHGAISSLQSSVRKDLHKVCEKGLPIRTEVLVIRPNALNIP